VRSVVEDYPADALFELCRGGFFLDSEIDPAGYADAWERLARDGRFAGGRDAWTRRLPEWAAAREPWVPRDADAATRAAAAEDHALQARRAQALAGVVHRLAEQTVTLMRARRWSEWADGLHRLLEARIRGFRPARRGEPGSAAREPIGGEDTPASGGLAAMIMTLAEMRLLDATGLPCSPQAALGYLEQAVAAGRVPIGSIGADGRRVRGDQGGLRVLGAEQARGLSFDALFILGMNVDLFPRPPREDPFLPDDARRRLREELERPVPVAADRLEEERLLLAHLLGAPRRRLTISWQRADDAGKARVPSLALREVARVALGAAEIDAVERKAARVSAHPVDRGRDAMTRLAILPPRDAGLLAALELRSPAALMGALDRGSKDAGLQGKMFGAREDLAPALSQMAAVEDGSAAPGAYDALVGPEAAVAPVSWSPSRLELLGSCPQQYFFRQVLKAGEWEEAADPHEVEARDIGAQVHSVLHDTYAALIAEKMLPAPAQPDAALASRAREHLGRAWRARTARLAAAIRPAYPLLWDLLSDQWLAALERFMRRDLEEMRGEPAAALLLEHEIESALPLAPFGAPLPLHGRLDRMARLTDGVLAVADYKTSGSIAEHASIKDALKGTRLQMALYAFLAESTVGAGGRARVRAEVLGVGPSYETRESTKGAIDPGARVTTGDASRVTVDPEALEKARAGILETLSVLRDLEARGLFPLNEDSRLCRFCPFIRACRRDHGPTLERLAGLEDLAAWRGVRRKNTFRPTLAMAAAAGVEDEA
jgi:RecB family exonuclease